MSYHDKFTAWYTCNKCKAKSSVEETDSLTPADLPKNWTRGSIDEHYCCKCSHSMNPKDLPTVLTFGKYKDLYVDEVITLNPSYLLWADKNISWFFLTLDQKVRAKSILSKINTKETRARIDKRDADLELAYEYGLVPSKKGRRYDWVANEGYTDEDDQDLYPEVDRWYGADN